MNAKLIQYIGLIALLKVIREISTGGVLSHRKSGSLSGDFIRGVYHRGVLSYTPFRHSRL